ncbi:hypothetical protein LSUB1_G001845 [Lachnellula subtilissima]|uniref:Amidohydrolase-related domain-containing protein n=1 Tax=Lachnellula subtilissima TaxID=602034 RepID=A0A8H8RUE7_9HELO|nr:hypothetical protein LSUB1_G001845 [Lachnellula subtilissima]
MQSIIYLFLTSLLGPSSVNGCLSGRHETDGSHIETQLELLGARSHSTPPTGKIALTNVRVFDGWTIGAVARNSTHATVFGATGFVTSPSEAPEFVADVFGNGPEYMKLIAEPNGFNQATHNALVSATHALGKVAMTHAQDCSYEVAIRSRTNGIQHVPFDIPLTEEMAQLIKQQAQYVTPTLNIGKIVTANATLVSILSGGVNLTYQAGVAGVQQLMRAGVPLLAGSDANDAAGSFLVGDTIGITLHRELQYLTDAGMSEVDALRAATVVRSFWHSLIGRGSIREGYRADLLLLKPGSDPLRNISQTMDIARVWNGGIEYVPTA